MRLHAFCFSRTKICWYIVTIIFISYKQVLVLMGLNQLDWTTEWVKYARSVWKKKKWNNKHIVGTEATWFDSFCAPIDIRYNKIYLNTYQITSHTAHIVCGCTLIENSFFFSCNCNNNSNNHNKTNPRRNRATVSFPVYNFSKANRGAWSSSKIKGGKEWRDRNRKNGRQKCMK